MANWRRTLWNARTFVGNAMGGLRGGSNLASWVVAGTLAYFLWVKPAQDLKKEQEKNSSSASPAPFSFAGSSSSQTPGWKLLADEWVSATAAIPDNSPDSINLPMEDEEGLPFPPLDEGALWATQTAPMQQLSEFFDEMDEDGNFRNNDVFKGKRETDRNIRIKDPEQKQQPPKQATFLKDKGEIRRQAPAVSTELKEDSSRQEPRRLSTLGTLSLSVLATSSSSTSMMVPSLTFSRSMRRRRSSSLMLRRTSRQHVIFGVCSRRRVRCVLFSDVRSRRHRPQRVISDVRS